MPRVPASPSVRPQPARFPSVPNTSIDISPIGQGFLQAARSAQQAADEISAIRLAEADTEFVNRVNDTLYRADKAYFKRVGKDAVDSLIPTEQQLEEIRQSVAEEYLDNGRDKRLFGNQSAQRLEAARNRMSVYASKEKERWDENVSIARVASHVETVHLDPGIEQIEEALPSVTAETLKHSADSKLPPEATQTAIHSAKSGVMRAGVDGAITNGNLGLAQALFEKYSDQMTADDRVAALRRISASANAAADSNAQMINETRQLIKGYEEALSRGWIPKDKDQIAAMVAGVNDDTTTNQWTNATRFDAEATEFAQMSLPQQREVLSWYRSGQGGGMSMSALLIDQLESIHERQVALANEDPLRLYVERTQQVLPDIRTESGMQQATRLAEQAERSLQVRTLPVTQEQMTNLQRRFTESDANTKSQMAGRMVAGFGPTMALRVFNELDGKLGKGIGVAGALTVEGQPNIGKMVLEGIERLDRDPSIIPSDVLQRKFDAELGGAYGGSGSRADRAIRQAIAGVYVELQRASGEFDDREMGDIDDDTLTSAIQLVTGGVLEYENRLVVAPRRGVTDKQFELWADSLTASDFDQVTGFDSEQAFNSWRANGFLESVGPGLYRPAFINPNGEITSFKIRTDGTDPKASFNQLRDLVLFYKPPEWTEPRVTTNQPIRPITRNP